MRKVKISCKASVKNLNLASEIREVKFPCRMSVKKVKNFHQESQKKCKVKNDDTLLGSAKNYKGNNTSFFTIIWVMSGDQRIGQSAHKNGSPYIVRWLT